MLVKQKLWSVYDIYDHKLLLVTVRKKIASNEVPWQGCWTYFHYWVRSLE